MDKITSGYEEIEHTADWALRVWAPDPADLFSQAAIGMNDLSEVELDLSVPLVEELALTGIDMEGLLVSFLTELVFFAEHDDLGFDNFSVEIDRLSLRARLTGGKIISRKKEIKAVTYHNLEVVKIDGGFQVVIVFDV